jgi:hypothetical protein
VIAAAFDELGNENRDVALGILASELAQVFEEWSVKVAESGGAHSENRRLTINAADRLLDERMQDISQVFSSYGFA